MHPARWGCSTDSRLADRPRGIRLKRELFVSIELRLRFAVIVLLGVVRVGVHRAKQAEFRRSGKGAEKTARGGIM